MDDTSSPYTSMCRVDRVYLDGFVTIDQVDCANYAHVSGGAFLRSGGMFILTTLLLLDLYKELQFIVHYDYHVVRLLLAV